MDDEDAEDSDGRQGASEDSMQQDDEEREGEQENLYGGVLGTAGGRIEEVHMVNFMKHDNMRVPLGRNLTFIVGHNGSGKSAVQQAVYIALNGRAKSNQRGALSELVKKGTAGGYVRVTLCNEGMDSYRQALFGNRIIVHRKVGSGGTGAPLQLLSQKGALISPKPKNFTLPESEPEIRAPQKELAALCEHYNIDVDNPITVMSQTNSKEFLQGSNDHKHYQLFMKATMLQNVRDQLDSTDDKLVKMKERLDSAESQLNEKKSKRDDRKQRIESIRKIDEMRDKRNRLIKQFKWAKVDDKENDISWNRAILADPNTSPSEEFPAFAKQHWGELTHKVQRIEQEKAHAESQLQQAEAEKQDALTRFKEEQNKTQELNQKSQNARVEWEELCKAQREAEDNRYQLANQLKKHDDHLHALETQISQSRQTLEEKMASDQLSDREREAQREANEALEQAEQKRTELSEAQNKEKQLFEKSNELTQQIQTDQEKLKDKRAKRDELKREVENKQNEIVTLNKQRTSVSTFGNQSVQTVLSKIQQGRGSFNKKPIGPVGAYLSLTDERWKLVAEVASEPSLDTVLVDSHADNRELQRIAKEEIGRKIPSNVAPFDRPLMKASNQNGVLTLLDVLKSEHAVVINFLVLRNNIAKIGLAEDADELNKLVFEGNSAVNQGFMPDGLKARRGLGVKEWQPLEAQRKQKPQPRLGADMTEILRGHENEQKKLEQELEEVNLTVNELQQRYDQQKQLLTSKQRERKQLQNACKDIEKEIQRLQDKANQQQSASGQDERDREIASTRESLKSLQQEYEQVEKRKEADQSRLRDAEHEKERVRLEIESKSQEVNELQNQAREVTRSDNPARSAYEEKDAEVKSLQQQLEKLRTKHEKKVANVNEAKEHLQQDENERDELQREAENFCSREDLHSLPEPPQPHQIGPSAEDADTKYADPINMEITKVERRIKEMEKSALGTQQDVESLERELQQLNEHCRKRSAQIGEAKEPMNKMRKMVKDRKEVQKHNQWTTASTVHENFQDVLRKRHFSGELDVDFDSGKINMRVTPPGDNHAESVIDHNGHNMQKRSTDMKQLSGGERSYTTLAFLLAVCKEAETPFFCADEFDVFMDEGNRHRALLELVEYAKEKQSTQFILLTPNDISPVQEELKHWAGQVANNAKVVSMGGR